MLQPSGYMKVSSYDNVKPSKTGATAIRRWGGGVWCGVVWWGGKGWREGGWREGGVGKGGGGGGGGGGDKGVGWSMQMASGSVAMICQIVEDGCYSFPSYLVSQQLSQYGLPLPLTVYSACAHRIWL